MRIISKEQSEKLYSTTNVRHANSDLSLDMWISRPTVPLTDSNFLERQLIPASGQVSDVSIAATHAKPDSECSHIFMGYIESGIAKVVMAKRKVRISTHEWVDCGLSEPASSISVAYDGVMKTKDDGRVEFITDTLPWVFWVNDGVLSARKLGTDETFVLAESNCTSVSAIRAAWSEVGSFDFGLVAFFLLDGKLYYRQLINGVWYDGELVSYGPSYNLVDVAAFRTWDFRIGVQLMDSSGATYEMFTQFMGIGTRSAEHFMINGASSSSKITPIVYKSVDYNYDGEHFEIFDAQHTSLYGGCYEIGKIDVITAWNEDDGSGDWGKRLLVKFTKELSYIQISEQITSFSFIDANGNSYFPSVVRADYTGRTIIFEFVSFNHAVGDITISYTPGIVSSMYGELLPGFSISFTPINLVPFDEYPKVLRMWNE